MKKTLAIVLFLLFLFGVASVSFAATKQVTGKVTAVDQKTMTITVHGRKGDVTASVDSRTKVVHGKDKKTLADVQVGDKVTLKYSKVDGKNMAKRVIIKKTAPAKKAAEPAKAAPGY